MSKEISEERKKELYDENYFWDHGDNPARKKLIEINAQMQTDRGGLPDLRVLVYGSPARLFPFRDFEDLIEKDLQCNTLFGSFIPLIVTFNCLNFALRAHAQVFPVGKYGIRNIRGTPFFKTWGLLGYIGMTSLPFAAMYFHAKSWLFTLKMFYNRVLLQDRDWLYERYKFNNPWGAYFYIDHPLSEQTNFPRDAALLIESRNKELINTPKWFKE